MCQGANHLFDRYKINVKIVYFGAGLSGGTTNVCYVYEMLEISHKGRLIRFATEEEQVTFTDFVSPLFPKLKGYDIRFHLYTPSGAVFLESSHKSVLKGVDAIVFVVDSQTDRMEANITFFEMLNCFLLPKTLLDIPNVLQINKRDCPDILSVETILDKLNYRSGQFTESIAYKGVGVLETFHLIANTLIAKFNTLDVSTLPITDY